MARPLHAETPLPQCGCIILRTITRKTIELTLNQVWQNDDQKRKCKPQVARLALQLRLYL